MIRLLKASVSQLRAFGLDCFLEASFQRLCKALKGLIKVLKGRGQFCSLEGKALEAPVEDVGDPRERSNFWFSLVFHRGRSEVPPLKRPYHYTHTHIHRGEERLLKAWKRS